MPFDGLAERVRLVRLAGAAREERHHLALPVALVEVLDAEALLERLDHRVRHRHHAGRAHRVVGVVGPRRLLPEEDVHGAEREHHGGAVVAAAVPELAHREALVDRARHARDERAIQVRDPRRGLVHGQARVDHLALAQVRVHRAVERGAEPHVVALHHALRAAGGARGPEDRGGVAHEERRSRRAPSRARARARRARAPARRAATPSDCRARPRAGTAASRPPRRRAAGAPRPPPAASRGCPRGSRAATCPCSRCSSAPRSRRAC